MHSNNIRKKYMHSVSKNIRCSKKDKKAYLDYISVSLDDFLYEHPDADYKQVCENLGEPKELAGELLAGTEVKKNGELTNVQKTWIFTCACVSMAVVIIYVTAMIISFIDACNGYAVCTYSQTTYMGSSEQGYII